MIGRIVALDPVQFQRWLAANNAEATMAARGQALFGQLGCGGCHGAGAAVRAPALEGLYGHPVPLANGTTVLADERYLRDAILLPAREVAAGYAPIMPTVAGQIGEGDLLDLIAYIKSLADKAPAPR
jgi:cytochrome c oxidase subunit 2